MRFFVVVQDDEIIVTSETGFRAAYCKHHAGAYPFLDLVA